MNKITSILILITFVIYFQESYAQHTVKGLEKVKGVQTFNSNILTIKPSGNFINQGTVRYKKVSTISNHGGFSNSGSIEANYDIPCYEMPIDNSNSIFDNSISETIITGSRPVRMNNVSVDRNIIVQNEWQIAGNFQLNNGIITTDKSNPDHFIHFLGSSINNIYQIDGYVGASSVYVFDFQLSDGNQRGPIQLHFDDCASAKAAYFRQSPDNATLPQGAPFSTTSLEPGLTEISNLEYWDIKGDDTIAILLHYDSLFGGAALGSNIEEFVIVGWNGDQWVNLLNLYNPENANGQILSRLLIPNEYMAFTYGKYCPSLNVGAIDSTGESLCLGEIPSTIENLEYATSGLAHVDYTWRSSTDNFTSAIPNANNAEYKPPANLSQTTTFKRFVNNRRCNTDPIASSGSWTVTILSSPEITCPDDLTVTTSQFGQDDCMSTVSWTNPGYLLSNCWDSTLVVSIANEFSANVSPNVVFSQEFSVGDYEVNYKLYAENELINSCSFNIHVIDDIPPVLTCSDSLIIYANGQSSINLSLEQLSVATDNCSLESVMMSHNMITASQFGQSIPVQVIAADQSGNAAGCIVNVTVRGLPQGWTHQTGSLGACISSVNYNYITAEWTASATNCVNNTPYQVDAFMFTQTQLCGNGSITAKISALTGAAAFAGITMRESNAPNAKKVQLTINRFSNFVRRAIRYLTGGQAFPNDFPNPSNRNWLRLVRNGNNFTGFTSADGISWWFVMQVNIPMNSCIEVGLVLENSQTGTQSHAIFSNVNVIRSQMPNSVYTERNLEINHPEMTVFPNPTTGKIQYKLTGIMGANKKLEIRNVYSQLIKSWNVDIEQYLSNELDLSFLPSGVYELIIYPENEKPLVAKFIINR
jgi:hypothetical protein